MLGWVSALQHGPQLNHPLEHTAEGAVEVSNPKAFPINIMRNLENRRNFSAWKAR